MHARRGRARAPAAGRLVLCRSPLSFVFYTTILAFSINAAARFF
jgi:uncharacterized membrane protein